MSDALIIANRKLWEYSPKFYPNITVAEFENDVWQIKYPTKFKDGIDREASDFFTGNFSQTLEKCIELINIFSRARNKNKKIYFQNKLRKKYMRKR